MFFKLLLLFTVVPIIELNILINLGRHVGMLPTILLVALTGIIGVSLAKSEGFMVVSKIRDSLSKGRMPTENMIGGILILLGGAMLLTPGLLTDIFGFLLIIPISRIIIAGYLRIKFKSYIKSNKSSFVYNYNSTKNNQEMFGGGRVYQEAWDDWDKSIDVDYEEVDE